MPTTIDLSTLPADQGFVIEGPGTSWAGTSVSSAGDINGDGIDDLVVGAPRGDGNGPFSGEVYVVFGRAGTSGPIDLGNLGAAGFVIRGEAVGDIAGYSVSSAGDVNGDGFDDLIVGARNANVEYTGPYGGTYLLPRAGQSYVVFGRGDGFAPVIELGALDGTDGFRLDGFGPEEKSGWSVASAGDVNGDGFGDLIVGAPFSPNGGEDAGRAYIVFGHAGAFDTIGLGFPGSPSGFTIQGDAAHDRAGQSVSSAGDVNGDGFDDLIIGASFGDNGGVDAGEAYVVFGKASGLAGTTIDLTSLGTAGFTIQGDANDDQAGYSVASAGDVNGDGFGDLIVGAPFGDNGGANAGEAYVVFGRAAGLAGTTIDLSNLGMAGFVIQGDLAGDWAGFSASSAGDVNGDGFGDLIVGAPYSDSGGTNAGMAYVVFGQATGLAGATIDLSALGAAGFAILGEPIEDRAGWSVSAAGDVNGDGFGDLTLGAPGNRDTYAEGEAYVVFGQAPATAVTRIGSAGDQTLVGGAFDDVLLGLEGNDILRGNAGRDLLVGGAGDDTYLVADAADVLFEQAGEGTDEVRTALARYRLGDNLENLTGTATTGQALIGNAGVNQLTGGTGNDTLNGREGADDLRGGLGNDTYVVGTAGVMDTVVELAAEGTDLIKSALDVTLGANLENLILVSGARVGTGNTAANSLTGSGGADTLSGLNGADVLHGGTGGDTLLGGNGNDTLDGGLGRDTLTGGANRDTFQFDDGDIPATRQLADVITDFDQAAGEKIDLHLVDANAALAGNQAFEFIGNGAFTGVAGQLHFAQQGGNTYVEGDTNGDGLADFAIRLNGTLALGAGDFVL